MFICGLSGKVSEPREKPVKVVLEERPARYTYDNLEAGGEMHVYTGHEIVREVDARLYAVDPEKAARIRNRPKLDIKKWEAAAAGYFMHAKRCKKPLDECASCQANVKFFALVPSQVLSHLLEEARFK